MKVLFYPLIQRPSQPGNRFYCDYMVDCLYHGFKSLLGYDLEESIELPQWYTDVDKSELYGNGFTIYGLIERKLTCPANNLFGTMEGKLKSDYYDQIIVPIHNNVYKSELNLDRIARLVANNPKKVKVICGNDDSFIDERISGLVPYFKREIYTDKLPYNIFPITFSVPKEKVLQTVPTKLCERSEEIPNHAGVEGWKIKDEYEYYKKYQDAMYAITYKKGGWDCMRHYEILMNGCFPYFINIMDCPRYTLHFLPKEYIQWTMERNTVSFDNLEHLLAFTRAHLTTEKMAKYILENGY